MTRVCLDCGTPKRPLAETCQVCQVQTITHEGVAREPLCRRCSWGKDGGCGFYDTMTQKNKCGTVKRFIGRRFDDVNEKLALYHYSCEEFKANYRDGGPSPNPLNTQEQQWIRLAKQTPMSFWLQDNLWDKVPEGEMCWSKENKTQAVTKTALGVGLLAVSAVLAGKDSK